MEKAKALYIASIVALSLSFLSGVVALVAFFAEWMPSVSLLISIICTVLFYGCSLVLDIFYKREIKKNGKR